MLPEPAEYGRVLVVQLVEYEGHQFAFELNHIFGPVDEAHFQVH
jgi:hypothetical protein